MRKFTVLIVGMALLFSFVAGCSGNKENVYPGGTYTMDDFEVVNVGTANVALGKLVLSNSSSYAGVYNSAYAVDGEKNNKGFGSGDLPYAEEADSYFTVDLDKAYNISEVKLYPVAGDESAFPSKMNVLVSSDGKNFTKKDDYSGKNASSDGISFKVDADNVRYVKVEVKAFGSGMPTAAGTAYYSIGEIEVLGVIDNTENLTLSKPALWMDVGAEEALSATYKVDSVKGDKIEWSSSDEGIVIVSESGVVTANAPGNAVIYAFDGKNKTECPVKVKNNEPSFTIGVYYNANHGNVTEETIQWLKDFGLDYIEIDHGYDVNGNNVNDWLIRKAAKLGVGTVMSDSMRYTVINDTDEAIIENYSKYKNREGFMGFMIWDEPIDVAPYGRVTRILSQLDFDAIVNVNLSPEDPGKFDEKVYEYMSAVGASGFKYLTYDQYPYTAVGKDFATNVFYSLDSMRKAGLAYNTDTGCYIQAFESGITRASSKNEQLYQMSVSMAYGMKNFKWFTWFTPVKYFTDAVLDINSGKGVMFDGGVIVNGKIHALSPYLANTDAVNVYHLDMTSLADKMPEDFALGFDKAKAIVTVFKDRDTGRETIGIVNKNFNVEEDTVITVNVEALNTDELYIIDSDGNRAKAEIKNGSIELTFAPGDIKLIELPEGASVLSEKEDKTNLALNAGVWASSSVLEGTSSYNVAAFKLVDGNVRRGYWKPAANDSVKTVTLILDGKQDISSLRIYKSGNGNEGTFPTSVKVSFDGTQVDEGELELKDDTFAVIKISGEAEYVTFDFSASSGQIEIGEIEIYG